MNCAIGWEKPELQVVHSGSIPTPTSLESFFRQIPVRNKNIHEIIKTYLERKCSVCHETPSDLDLNDFAKYSLEKISQLIFFPNLTKKKPLLRFPTCHHFSCFECMRQLTTNPANLIDSLDPRDFGCPRCPNNCEELCDCDEFDEIYSDWDTPMEYYIANCRHKMTSARTMPNGSCPTCCSPFMDLTYDLEGDIGFCWEFRPTPRFC
tara:strand:+ start:882 stop:1502 length:621 start_codon:yes stop_codon:yes gene_type:complete